MFLDDLPWGRIEEARRDFSGIHETVREHITLKKEEWGYIAIEVISDAPWLLPVKNMITAADFVGGHGLVEYMIEPEYLHAGKNFGRITLQTPFQTRKVELVVDQGAKDRESSRQIIRRKQSELVSLYIDMGIKKIVTGEWAKQTVKKTEELMELEPDNLWYLLTKAQAFLVNRQRQEGEWALDTFPTLSLLLERSPGREAYPGDVFYLHSRLLERSARLSDEKGGGSITALPIIETQAGDVSAYIPTNVISITDGQIFLESDLFFSGMRPAVNVGLSVSRVGGAAQTKAMKKVAGSIRIDLAQFREMEVFTQFASDLDSATKEQLLHGHVLMELLKQPLCRPLSMAEQVITLSAANAKIMLSIPIQKVKDFQMKLLAYMKETHSGLMRKLETTGVLDDELNQEIVNAALAIFSPPNSFSASSLET